MSVEQVHIVSNVIFGGGEQSLLAMSEGVGEKCKIYLLRQSSEFPNRKNIFNKSLLRAKHSYGVIDQVINLIYSGFFLIWILKYDLKKNSNTKIVFHGFPFQFTLFVSLFYFKRNKIYFVYHQNKRLKNLINYIVGFFESFILIKSKVNIYTVSENSRKDLKKYFEYFGIKNIPIGIFLNTINPVAKQEKCQQFKNIYKGVLGKKIFIYPARFHKEKCHERILKIAENLNHCETVFILLGDGPEYNKIANLVTERELNNVLMPGSISRSCMTSFFNLCDGVIFPSDNESFGLVFYESLYFLKPVFVWNSDFMNLKNIHFIEEIYDFINDGGMYYVSKKYSRNVLSQYTPHSTFNSLH